MIRSSIHVMAGALLAFGILMYPQSAGSVGGQFGLEFAIDAPWRLEPIPVRGGPPAYGPIPITIAFYDASYELDRSTAAKLVVFPQITVGKLLYVEVVEWVQDQPHPRQPTIRIHPGVFREFERKRPVSTKQIEPPHEVCRPFLGQDCSPLLDISDSHEWHALFWYAPRGAVTPGRNIHLEVTVVTELAAGLYKREWKNYLVVHAGEAPLPRFADKWLYGDLHYHSQMTDNEGESGYSYRNVVRALGALGMDFLFTTDHASNGVQVDGSISAKYCPKGTSGQCVEARDLNQGRFAAAKNIIYGSDGANEAVARDAQLGGLARLRSANILPQLYMAEEVDAWPEMSSKEQQEGVIHYGDGLKYSWPNPNNCIQKEGLDKCRSKYSQTYADRDHRTYLVLDEQGIPIEETIDEKFADHDTIASIVKFFTPDGTKILPSRQHLVYFPTSSNLSADGWIASDTGQFGGAGKRLQDVIQEVQAGGVAFLAHPLVGSGPGGPGPDIVPYSDTELTRAWSSPAMLGLQFWNENDRHYSAPDVRSPTVMFTGASSDDARTTNFKFNWPFQGHTYGNFPWFWQHGSNNTVAQELYQGAFTWDRMLRKGLNPVEIAPLTWLPKGEPRKWFMAGGSDSHGDLNYRRYGRPCLDRWCDVPVADTAIGNPRNLVLVTQPPAGAPVPSMPTAKRYTNGQVIEALRNGQFSVTDGPAIRIAVDKNRNGKIDDEDFQMGSTVHFFPGEHIPLLVEWISTPEFGPIAQVDIYVGNMSNTYAPKYHGPTIPPAANRNPEYGAYQPDPSGVLQVKLVDNFGRFNVADLPPEAGFHGMVTVFIGPAQFGLVKQDQALSYVRAFVKTNAAHQASDLGQCPKLGTAGSKCGDRFAYSNPIWARYRVACPPQTRAVQPQILEFGGLATLAFVTPYLDADNNSIPDTCEREIPNPCPVVAPPGGGRLGGVTGVRPDVLPPVLVDPSKPAGPQPAKIVPGASCKVVKSLFIPVPPGVTGTVGTSTGTIAPSTEPAPPPPGAPPTPVQPVFPGKIVVPPEPEEPIKGRKPLVEPDDPISKGGKPLPRVMPRGIEPEQAESTPAGPTDPAPLSPGETTVPSGPKGQ